MGARDDGSLSREQVADVRLLNRHGTVTTRPATFMSLHALGLAEEVRLDGYAAYPAWSPPYGFPHAPEVRHGSSRVAYRLTPAGYAAYAAILTMEALRV